MAPAYLGDRSCASQHAASAGLLPCTPLPWTPRSARGAPTCCSARAGKEWRDRHLSRAARIAASIAAGGSQDEHLMITVQAGTGPRGQRKGNGQHADHYGDCGAAGRAGVGCTGRCQHGADGHTQRRPCEGHPLQASTTRAWTPPASISTHNGRQDT